MQKPVTQPRYQMLADLLRQCTGSGGIQTRGPASKRVRVVHRTWCQSRDCRRAIEQLVYEGSSTGGRVPAALLPGHPCAGGRVTCSVFPNRRPAEGMRSTQALLSIDKAAEDLVREFQCGGPAISASTPSIGRRSAMRRSPFPDTAPHSQKCRRSERHRARAARRSGLFA